jgi:outer membrane protein assembly factor BamB
VRRFLIPLVATLGLLSVPASASAGTSTPGASFHVDVAHDGNSNNSGFNGPVRKMWARSWTGTVSYAVIGDGKVFVSVSGLHGTNVRRVFALDPATGATLWSVVATGGYGVFGLAEDAGRLFTVNSTGLLSALDTDTGSLDWSVQLPGQYMFTSPPTADSGVVYVGGAGSGGTVYAVDESTGDVLWTQSVENGDHSAPTITPYGVVVGYACFQVYDLGFPDGSVVWHHSTGCEGGGGSTTAYYSDSIFARGDSGEPSADILNAATGSDIGSYTNGPIPAFSGTSGFFLENGTLRERDLSTMRARWSFAGDGSLVSEPLVIDTRLFVASSSGRLYVLRPNTGHVRRTCRLGAPFTAPDEHNAGPLTGLNAGGGLLLVPATNRLVAFG